MIWNMNDAFHLMPERIAQEFAKIMAARMGG